jgi:hypothetical protein
MAGSSQHSGCFEFLIRQLIVSPFKFTPKYRKAQKNCVIIKSEGLSER